MVFKISDICFITYLYLTRWIAVLCANFTLFAPLRSLKNQVDNLEKK